MDHMEKWFVQDKRGREIYLTAERWQHIIDRHPYLRGHREDVLATIKYGRRKQQPRDPQAYVYYHPCNTLPALYTGIQVVVVFRLNWDEVIEVRANNFIVTAWGIRWRSQK